ncbi:hypothetical protein ORV05_05045 [Amycolatopsis cynarae]|uniref:DUF1003 domain-containing protein n=1 Tax=Amycolatopsis cynarae TaxID=2995223 RepID=A0ABY7B4B3_9PSEU|nr:hypothetical protein [Amycolatopsis sp. HUAS 11-8]WAL67159.1 hypothetical protein ORV05_05045 [Amycolatopsis sp. HUAS 11-8]
MNINDRIAMWLTKVFGTMWMTYAFAVYGTLGAIFTDAQPVLLYWSNWVQLWSLPLLLVGTTVINRAAEQRAEQRAQETHDAVMEELRLVREENEGLKTLMQLLSPDHTGGL